MNLQDRERVVLETLEDIPKDDNTVLIGGYALNAYVPPRFSVDCDLVLLDDPQPIERALQAHEFAKTEQGTVPYGDYIRYTRDDDQVSFDLLIDSVQDRATGVTFPKRLFQQHAHRRTTVGRATPVRIDLCIADPELLFAMKFVPGRRQDIRDLFMLAGENLDWDTIHTILQDRCSPEILQDRATLVNDTIQADDYRDNLQGPYGKIPDTRYDRSKTRLQAFLDQLASIST